MLLPLGPVKGEPWTHWGPQGDPKNPLPQIVLHPCNFNSWIHPLETMYFRKLTRQIKVTGNYVVLVATYKLKKKLEILCAKLTKIPPHTPKLL
jgi:hypothetical protein